MPQTAPLGVQLVAKTEFVQPAGVPWTTDADGGQALAEFAGRACYQSWGKPNPATATNAGYLRHILEVGHLSVLEHGTVSFYLTGVSRSLTHKQARQAARAILPNATETRIVVTGNYRAWRHFIGMRATEHADVEIRALAIECLRQLQREVPNVFNDFEIATLEDGTEIASSPFVTEG
jgi:thymidylate synthase ThyX